MATIHECYDYIPPKPSVILQLHGDLYKFSGKSAGGNYKNSDNMIEERDEQGVGHVGFQPVPAWETSEAIDISVKLFPSQFQKMKPIRFCCFVGTDILLENISVLRN